MIVNPMTGERLNVERNNTLLIFRLDSKCQERVGTWAAGKYQIIDCSDDMVDLLAIPAAILVADPMEMDSDDINIFNEILCDNIDNSIVVLTEPFPIKADFKYLQVMN